MYVYIIMAVIVVELLLFCTFFVLLNVVNEITSLATRDIVKHTEHTLIIMI